MCISSTIIGFASVPAALVRVRGSGGFRSIIERNKHVAVSHAPEVSPAQATELINRQGAQIVDVRKAADFAKGHIANSRNIPADQIQNEFGKLKRERPVILVDQTGAGSRPVARLLRGVGFQRVTILERGIVGWLQAKMPLE